MLDSSQFFTAMVGNLSPSESAEEDRKPSLEVEKEDRGTLIYQSWMCV